MTNQILALREHPVEQAVRCVVMEATGDYWKPFSAYLRELQACGRSASTQRSYGMDLLRWFRFLWTVGVGWDRATRVEARDFCPWLQISDKPVRPHWRRAGEDAQQPATPTQDLRGVRAGESNPVTGKAAPGVKYAAATAAHCETVLRSFYDFHLEAGSGPMLNPFPLSRERRGSRANAHHNPMDSFKPERTGRYRPKVVVRIPRQIPDERFDELSLQQLPASPDAFVWLRLYQAQMQGLSPVGPDQPLW